LTLAPLLRQIWYEIAKRTHQAEHRFFLYGFISFFGFSSFYFINLYLTAPNTYEDFALRMVATFLSLGLMLSRYWSPQAKVFMPIYWNFTLIYTLPFFFGFMLFKNNFDVIWCLNALISLTLLIFITDWISAALVLLIGVISAWVYYFFYFGEYPQLPDNIFGILASYIGMLIYIGLFVYKEEKIRKEKLLTLKSLAGTVAHEMRTPFLGIRASAKVISKFLPTLVESYQKASSIGQKTSKISKDDLKNLAETPADLEKITLSASMVIDMLLMNLKDPKNLEKDLKLISIKECIDEAIRNYPLTEEEREIISWEGVKDFSFYGNKLLIKHVFFNLLKNALYYVKEVDNGHISVWSEIEPSEFVLYFKDTGSGISESVLPHIFDTFYSKTHYGTGIGLSFCHSVMKSLGGSIACESKENEYTTFILSFPKSNTP
jgi:signal transduction histidine kinase